MKRLFGMIVAAIGGALSLWALTSLLMTQDQIFGYHPMWPGLVGAVLLTVGLITRQD